MRDPLVGHLHDAVTAAWAEAVPAIALIALWARGDLAPVYAVADALPPVTRPGMLAWLAALDPEPAAPRALRAAREALRDATFHAHHAVLTLVPLADPAVAELARRTADYQGRTLLDLREGRVVAAPAAHDPPLLRLLHAAGLAERDDAAIKGTLTESFGDPTCERAMIPLVQRLDAWALVPKAMWSWDSVQWLAFAAGRFDPSAVDRLTEQERADLLLVPAALGAGRVEDAWRPTLAGLDVQRFDEFLAEGLYSAEEGWNFHLAHALTGPNAYATTDALLLDALASAHARALAFTEGLLTPPARDDDALAREAQRLDKAIAGITDERAVRRAYRRLLRPARRLADRGGAAEVRRALATLEERWGPAPGWITHERWSIASDSDTVAELLACAEGRSLAALELDTRAAELPAATRVRICAGLARDGHLDALAAPFERVLRERHAPADVVLLARAALALAPEAEATYRDALTKALAALPSDPAGARAWLAACDRAGLRRARA